MKTWLFQNLSLSFPPASTKKITSSRALRSPRLFRICVNNLGSLGSWEKTCRTSAERVERVERVERKAFANDSWRHKSRLSSPLLELWNKLGKTSDRLGPLYSGFVPKNAANAENLKNCSNEPHQLDSTKSNPSHSWRDPSTMNAHGEMASSEHSDSVVEPWSTAWAKPRTESKYCRSSDLQKHMESIGTKFKETASQRERICAIPVHHTSRKTFAA